MIHFQNFKIQNWLTFLTSTTPTPSTLFPYFPPFLPTSFLQKTFSTIQTLNRAVSQFLRCFFLFVFSSLLSNVWRVSRLKSHSLFPNSKMALTDWLTKGGDRAARAAKKWLEQTNRRRRRRWRRRRRRRRRWRKEQTYKKLEARTVDCSSEVWRVVEIGWIWNNYLIFGWICVELSRCYWKICENIWKWTCVKRK